MQTLRRLAAKPCVVMPLVAVLGLGGWCALRSRQHRGRRGRGRSRPGGRRDVGPMTLTLSAEGTIAPAETDDLSFATAGTVTAVNVAAGDTVAAGQVLASIDSAELAPAVAEAEAAVADAEAKLADDEDAGASDAQLAADESSLAVRTGHARPPPRSPGRGRARGDLRRHRGVGGLTVGEELASAVGGTDRTGR